ncbi:uncharacterized protein A1O9_02092 [Exophiala aquamarina CBS 119918]|uniref:Uncharacterized protein n=1 Tax=Exophiala aquamarina CBS 119918 TaxID=1182545 RepID=A0A072PKX2_9EURO|nr:uncharacterized protein A1O9_02092 [Exophiala aquamarina CBS 119918]KEF60531.1 hypothetical protein A1O9_02092 [Exophiala aquamarina CBS 119918]
MYALSIGVQHINNRLPNIEYALLSGLNASTVGIVALAAVQLAEKAIKDTLTRVLVITGPWAGLCYTPLWYLPVLILTGGIVTSVCDLWLQQQVGKVKVKWVRRRRGASDILDLGEADAPRPVELTERNGGEREGPGLQRRNIG